jgi:hypothetical protein
MKKSDNVTVARPAVYPFEAGKVYVSDGTYELAVGDNVDEQVIALCVLPIGCIPLDFKVISDDLDTGGPSIVYQGGGINAAEDDVDQVMITNGDCMGTGGVDRADAFPIVAPLTAEKLFGVHISTAATTPAGGTIRGILTYRATEYGG